MILRQTAQANGRPVFALYNPDNDPKTLKKMIDYWDDLAKENGFPGMYIIAKNNHGENTITPYSYRYEPICSGWDSRTILDKINNRIRRWHRSKCRN